MGSQMPAAINVHPQKWGNDLTVLFDNGEYSVVSGTYQQDDGTTTHSLGERWNGDGDELGFPNCAGYPIFHVVPNLLAVPILHGLLDEFSRQPVIADRDEYVRRIVRELQHQHAEFAAIAA